MKISLNWIKNFTDINLDNDEIVKRIGSQLGEVEEVIELGPKYQDVIIAEVIEVKKHDNADKLSVCLIDDGRTHKSVVRVEDGLVQVVCGAPNVRAGMKVAWLPPGSTVPETYGTKEPFVLDSRELRGVISNGMLASAKELDLGNDHTGILEVDAPAKNGSSFADAYEYTGDVLVDIENKMFTHRPDLFGIMGVAREIAGIQNIQFTSPDWYKESVAFADASGLPLHIRNKAPKLAPRFVAVAIKDVEVKQSPVIMRSYLSRVGLKPINNIVDITNFMMYVTAQPLHAFDYDKVAKLAEEDGAVIEVKTPNGNEQLELLNGKTIEPHIEDLCIATPKKLIGLAGVMGGTETEVDNASTNIILEVANFDMYAIRRTSMRHGLFTDAVTRFTKGQSPLQIPAVMSQAMTMIFDLAGGKQASPVHDNHADLPEKTKLKVDTEFLNDRLDVDWSPENYAEQLQHVEFNTEPNKNSVNMVVPFWRQDIAIPEDIVEESGRLYGYDNLPHTVLHRSFVPQSRDELLLFKQHMRKVLARGGANELLTYSFVNGHLLESANQDPKKAHKITNALSPDLEYYRLSITPSILNVVHQNLKAGFDHFALFEIAKTHNNFHQDEFEKDLPHEIESVGLVVAANNNLKVASQSGAAFYAARNYCDYLGDSFGLQLVYAPVPDDADFPITKPFDLKRSALVSDQLSGEFIGIVGEYRASTRRNLKLPDYAAGFELSTEALMIASRSIGSNYIQASKYPSIDLDVTLQVDNNVSFQDLTSDLFKAEAESVEKGIHIDRIPLTVYAPDDKKRNFSFRYTFISYDKTLSTDEANEELKQIVDKLKTKAKQI